MLVEPASAYENTTIVLTETSISLYGGAEYDMKSRSGRDGGDTSEIYYDQLTGVRSKQERDVTELEIQTSGGDSTRITSYATDTVDELVSEIRHRIRELKGSDSERGRNTEPQSANRVRSAATPHKAATQAQADRSSVSASADRSVDEENATRETDGASDADRATADSIAAVADTVASRTRPTDPVADELCRVLAEPSPAEDSLEEALQQAVDRLEEAGTVADAIDGIDDPTADAQIQSAKRTISVREGDIADGLEPVFDRVLDESAEAATIEADLSETETELERATREYDRIGTAAETVCREADRSGALTFQSTDIADRTAELADALEREAVTFERPGATRETETGLASLAGDLERSIRTQSPQSQELLETLSEPTSNDTTAVLRSTVDSLDAYAELQASIADIGEHDVRRRLDALNDELQAKDGAIYRHLADRVRELEAMLEREGITDVQLYAIYQESTFYDRTLLPRLSRSVETDDAAETGRSIAALEDRIDAIEREYIGVRADHNHTIPRHFLSLANDLRAEAQRINDERPMHAAGLCSAADEILAHIEALYEQNEYSVMLRRLRG
ncbi:hypothetical protein [Natrinema sp. 74]|uniref:hypothetical protein n=1 Tax=Natrinema sp. 74 TaxID=3384159 RepID=UPI0038D4D5D6